MRWPWSKKRPAPPPTAPAAGGGAKAHKEAAAHLAQASAHWPEVKRVSQSLRELRERNHFADQITLIFEGGEKRDR